jgi:hypothetical protein
MHDPEVGLLLPLVILFDLLVSDLLDHGFDLLMRCNLVDKAMLDEWLLLGVP